MDRYRFLQLDVFTTSAFSGNPLAVFPEAEGLSDELMQRIAREMNLSETVFVLPTGAAGALRRLRIFTPTRELPMAGHPVVGTWNALAREGVVPVPEGGNGWTRIMQEIGIGVLPVEIEFRDTEPVRVVMTQGRFEIQRDVAEASALELITRGLSLSVEELDETLPVQVASTGVPMLLIPIRTLEALGRCRVNNSIFSEVGAELGITEWYVFSRETLSGGEHRAHARLFAPAIGITEDPATGGAAGPLASYLVHHGALDLEPDEGFYRFIIEQGDFIERPSRISVEIRGERGRIEETRVGGPSVVVAHGELSF
ncbi:MAG: PhzF family phenazine biosynthesis protein [Acidobacteria bacterium]|nr:PhzF family phenazine biosynthesis protein [Acidobacteriota bacterium]